RGVERRRWGARFVEALVIPLLSSVGPFGMWASGAYNPVYDLHFLAFDDTLGFRPTALMVRFFDTIPGAYAVGLTAYLCITIATIAAHARTRTSRHPVDLLVAFTLAGTVGFALYFVLPGIGPTWTFADHYAGVIPALGAVVAEPFEAVLGHPRN